MFRGIIMENSTAPGTDTKVAGGAPANGVPGSQTSASAAEEARRKAMERAEEMADRLGEQVGHYVSSLGHTMLKWFARAREEAEDIWAEAKAIQERQRAADKPSDGAPRGNG
jgi:hypothetical protein